MANRKIFAASKVLMIDRTDTGALGGWRSRERTTPGVHHFGYTERRDGASAQQCRPVEDHLCECRGRSAISCYDQPGRRIYSAVIQVTLSAPQSGAAK